MMNGLCREFFQDNYEVGCTTTQMSSTGTIVLACLCRTEESAKQNYMVIGIESTIASISVQLDSKKRFPKLFKFPKK